MDFICERQASIEIINVLVSQSSLNKLLACGI